MTTTIEIDDYRYEQIKLAVEAIRMAGTLNNWSNIMGKIRRLEEIHEQLSRSDRANERIGFLCFLLDGEEA